MSGQIFQPNFIDVLQGSLLQGLWRTTDRCYRPSETSKLPIICGAIPAHYETPTTNATYGEDFADQFRTYSTCCPEINNSKSNATNTYSLTQQCPYIACFTDNEGIARAFDQWVQDRTRVALEQMRETGKVPANATIAKGGTGRCEYIDFAELKKSVRSGANTYEALTLQGLLVFVLGMFVVCGL